ncbi:hypothetical protein [Erythrobacter sp.]|uniref:hypothetical protein n=1 Tax=Erythrobacter sp. TaxID=1042 RepID=UPI003C7215BE
MKTWRIMPVLLPILALCGCEEERAVEGPVETGGEAAGEVLGGTISDEMLPLEQLTSTPPPGQGDESGDEEETEEE